MRRMNLSLRVFGIGLIYSVALVTLLLLGQERAAAQNADMVLHNGKILTVDDDFAVAEAVAIQGQRIQAVGSDAEILPLAGPGTQVVDLKGRTVIPGLIDTHQHLHSYAERVYGEGVDPATLGRYRVDWRGVTSKDDVLAQIKGLMDKYQFAPGEWIYFVNDVRLSGLGEGSTVDQAKIIMDDLNRWEIDKVTPNNPVIMTMGIPIANGLMVNSKAIEILWERYGYFLEKYGRYWVDESGRPEGHMEPPATRIIRKFMPSPSLGKVSDIYKSYLDELAAMGVTTVSSKMFPYSLEAFKLLDSKGELSLRLAYGMRDFFFGTITDLDHGLEGLGNLIGAGNDKIWVNAVGASGVDGAGSRACTNLKRSSQFGTIAEWWPTGQCHTDLEYRGAKGRAARTEGNYFREWVYQSARNGVRFANTHVAGDRSVANMLDMVEEIHEELGPSSTQGWAFDHCTLIDPADFERAARLNIIFSCAPKYIHSVAPAAAASYGDEVA
ncbi:MAG: amidohydrolase family protein, partial [Acidobacteria bacterium]|nr:amidohydrolase family protein [Acidobacteriota bacterium]